ncbi:hypothetical protein K438DRAFT_1769979 [Mycena galopus ATCC 62051]|nr:hypothetical protein K438DRAFT_1769979 [Mycena galopus ATCC 62051]
MSHPTRTAEEHDSHSAVLELKFFAMTDSTQTAGSFSVMRRYLGYEFDFGQIALSHLGSLPGASRKIQHRPTSAAELRGPPPGRTSCTCAEIVSKSEVLRKADLEHISAEDQSRRGGVMDGCGTRAEGVSASPVPFGASAIHNTALLHPPTLPNKRKRSRKPRRFSADGNLRLKFGRRTLSIYWSTNCTTPVRPGQVPNPIVDDLFGSRLATHKSRICQDPWRLLHPLELLTVHLQSPQRPLSHSRRTPRRHRERLLTSLQSAAHPPPALALLDNSYPQFMAIRFATDHLLEDDLPELRHVGTRTARAALRERRCSAAARAPHKARPDAYWEGRVRVLRVRSGEGEREEEDTSYQPVSYEMTLRGIDAEGHAIASTYCAVGVEAERERVGRNIFTRYLYVLATHVLIWLPPCDLRQPKSRRFLVKSFRVFQRDATQCDDVDCLL